MANLKTIPYHKMTPAQQESARKWAEKWGMTPQEYPLHPKLGAITNKKKIIAKIGEEAYDILSKGSKNGYVDRYCDITDEVHGEGTLYHANISVYEFDGSDGSSTPEGEPIYTISTAHYESGVNR